MCPIAEEVLALAQAAAAAAAAAPSKVVAVRIRPDVKETFVPMGGMPEVELGEEQETGSVTLKITVLSPVAQQQQLQQAQRPAAKHQRRSTTHGRTQ